MDEIDLKTFNQQFSEAFPYWEPTEYENKMWAGKLCKLELWQAQDALAKYFESMSQTESKGKPTMSKFLKFLKFLPRNQTVQQRLNGEYCITLVRRNKGENSFWVQPIHFKPGFDPQQMYEIGLHHQELYSERYGGKWYLFCEMLKPGKARRRVLEIEHGERSEEPEMPEPVYTGKDLATGDSYSDDEDLPW
jgi:hypothetical protein